MWEAHSGRVLGSGYGITYVTALVCSANFGAIITPELSPHFVTSKCSAYGGFGFMTWRNVLTSAT